MHVLSSMHLQIILVDPLPLPFPLSPVISASSTQAIDRVHRIGQEHPVLVYRLISDHVIEEDLFASGRWKLAVVERVVASTSIASRSLPATSIVSVVASAAVDTAAPAGGGATVTTTASTMPSADASMNE